MTSETGFKEVKSWKTNTEFKVWCTKKLKKKETVRKTIDWALYRDVQSIFLTRAGVYCVVLIMAYKSKSKYLSQNCVWGKIKGVVENTFLLLWGLSLGHNGVKSFSEEHSHGHLYFHLYFHNILFFLWFFILFTSSQTYHQNTNALKEECSFRKYFSQLCRS